ncbi:hypothetical protein NL676_033225 [Syzygium grande]|nr:hypothetical protein NL676_033225 [Syzygium grande]
MTAYCENRYLNRPQSRLPMAAHDLRESRGQNALLPLLSSSQKTLRTKWGLQSIVAVGYPGSLCSDFRPCRRIREREERTGREERMKPMMKSVNLYSRKMGRSMLKYFACSVMADVKQCVSMGPSAFAT